MHLGKGILNKCLIIIITIMQINYKKHFKAISIMRQKSINLVMKRQKNKLEMDSCVK